MTRTPTKLKVRSAPPADIQLPAVIDPSPGHPHQNLDRALRAAVARLTGGVSPHAFIEAWGDWVLHLSRAPGRQLELVERAQANAVKLMLHAASPGAAPAFAPKSYDHRFEHPGWQSAPFHIWQQGFLAAQDWWDYATAPLLGLRREDAGRARFMARQILDIAAPSNFPWLNPEIIAETIRSGGSNLTTGAAHFSRDTLKTLAQRHDPAPEGYLIPTAFSSDLRPSTGGDGSDGLWVVGEEVPSLAAGVDDVVAAFEDADGEPVGAKVSPDVLDR